MSDSDSGLSPAALQYKHSPGHFLGPILVASMIDIWLFGILVVYFLSYWRYWNDSSTRYKILVALLVTINVAQTAVVCFTVYTVFGTGFGYWEGALTNVYFEGIMMLEAMAGCLSQLFFAERAFTLLRRTDTSGWVFLSICVPGILAGLALGLSCGATTVISATVNTDFSTFYILQHLILAWKSVSVFTDLLITTTIVACLFKSRTGRSSDDGIILKVVRWIIEAQTLPLAAALLFLASYASDPGANLCIVPSFAEGKVCALSVLHVLNSRGQLRHDTSLLNQPPGLKSTRAGEPIREHGEITVSTVVQTRYSLAPIPSFSTTTPHSDNKADSTTPSPDLDAISEIVSLVDNPLARKGSETSFRRRGSVKPRGEEGEEGYEGMGRSTTSPLPDIDMIDTSPSRIPVGEIRTQSMSAKVVPFEEVVW